MPPLPHNVSLVPSRQTVPSQQPLQVLLQLPVWQMPPWQVPPGQVVPSVLLVKLQLPCAVHVPVLQGSVVQSVHCPPALPQADAVLPELQLVPLTQPVQQLAPMHTPPLQLTVPLTAVLAQPLLVQLSVVHGLLSSQSLHVSPLTPHCAFALPGRQACPS